MTSSVNSIIDQLKQLPQTPAYLASTAGTVVSYPIFSTLLLEQAHFHRPAAEIDPVLKSRFGTLATLYKGPAMMLLGPAAFVGVDRLRGWVQAVARKHGTNPSNLKRELAIDFGIGAIVGGFFTNPAMVLLTTAHREQCGLLRAVPKSCSGSILPNLFRGSMPHALTVGVMSAATFSGYDVVQERTRQLTNSSLVAHYAAGISAGIAVGIINTPLSIAASLRNTDVDRRIAKSAYDGVKQAWAAKGAAGFALNALMRSVACASFVLIYRGVKEHIPSLVGRAV